MPEHTVLFLPEWLCITLKLSVIRRQNKRTLAFLLLARYAEEGCNVSGDPLTTWTSLTHRPTRQVGFCAANDVQSCTLTNLRSVGLANTAFCDVCKPA
jgi:hypothetical protein